MGGLTIVRRLLSSLCLLICTCLTLTLTGCDSAPEGSDKQIQTKAEEQSSAKINEEGTAQVDAPPPPAPPIIETFDDKPQLSLFPRVAGSRPGSDEAEGLAYWKTFIEHLQKTSGIAREGGMDGSNGWMFRGNDGLPSLGFFSPLAVQPATTYRISFDFRGDLPEQGEAGAGILEFRTFLWIGDQFTEKQLEENLLRAQKGVSLSGSQEWGTHSFDFTTTEQTGMIHLILFREGEQTREPVFYDNIRIAPSAQTTEK